MRKMQSAGLIASQKDNDWFVALQVVCSDPSVDADGSGERPLAAAIFNWILRAKPSHCWRKMVKVLSPRSSS